GQKYLATRLHGESGRPKTAPETAADRIRWQVETKTRVPAAVRKKARQTDGRIRPINTAFIAHQHLAIGLQGQFGDTPRNARPRRKAWVWRSVLGETHQIGANTGDLKLTADQQAAIR